ncbi:MAG: ABC-ATPase domain-containing protein [Thermodesulfobacteriota bacterium]
MQKSEALQNTLQRIDGKGYKAYKDIQGEYDFGTYTLHIDNVQSDPFAPPSRMRVTVPQEQTGFPGDFYCNKIRKIAFEDCLTRKFARAVSMLNKAGGKGSDIGIDKCGQEILQRTSMLVTPEYVQARFVVGLPAKGRTILGSKARGILFQDLSQVVRHSLYYENLQKEDILRHLDTAEDQQVLRESLKERGLVAFIGNGSILPRESGVSERPLSGKRTISFQSPAEMETSFELPHTGQVKGMGIQEGVNLVVGGGYHGKSTLLRSLELGIYNHVPGDGRELVVSLDSSCKIRAEDGRSIKGVDIQSFISDLPHKEDTSCFFSENASGSTSQAANIVEALEAGTELLLLDEDTSATNFMIRDGRMQQLVSKEFEPITPFIDRVREMYNTLGVSTIVVLGGSGDYFDIADTVIMLSEYLPYEVTGQAKEIASRFKTERSQEKKTELSGIRKRIPGAGSFKLPEKGKVKAKGMKSILFGREAVDLSQVEQLVDESQTRTIAEIFRLLQNMEQAGNMPLGELVDYILQLVDSEGLDRVSAFYGKHPGNLAFVRKQEICAAINRYRKLQVKQ